MLKESGGHNCEQAGRNFVNNEQKYDHWIYLYWYCLAVDNKYLKSTVPKMSFKLIRCSGTNVKIKIIKMKNVYDISDI